MLVAIILWGAVVPAATAAAVLAAFGRRWLKASSADAVSGGVAAPALAIGLSFAAGYAGYGAAGIVDAPTALSWSASARLWATALALTGASVAEALWIRRALWRWALRLVASACVSYLLLSLIFVPQAWSTLERLGWLSLVAAAIALAWTSLSSAAAAEKGAVLSLLTGTIVAVAATASVFAGLASNGQSAALLLPGLGLLFLYSLRAPANGAMASAAGVIAVLLIGHLVIACFFGEMPKVAFLLLSLSPALLLVGRLPAIGRLPRAAAIIVRLCAIGLPLAAAASISAHRYFGPASGDTAPAATPGSPATDDDYGYD